MNLHDRSRSTEVDAVHDNAEVFHPKVEHLFSYLQIATAIFDSFAHGANDVANSIGPFAAVYAIYTTKGIPERSEVPEWILILGGLGIITGLATLGYKIIMSIGIKLTKITPARGFAIELSSALVVVLASRVGIPVSTTHCQVGSTMGVGIKEGKAGINWKLFLKIAASWMFTIVFAALVSASVFSFAAYSPSLATRKN